MAGDGLAHGEPFDAGEIEREVAVAHLEGSGDFLRQELEKILSELHGVVVVAIGLVILEHGEFGVVLEGDAFVAEVAVDFVHAVEAADDQALQVKLRGDAEEKVDVEGFVMGDKRAGHGPAGDGLHHGRFHFKEAAGVEENAHLADEPGALEENLANAIVGEQIEVALAETQLDVHEAVPFFG